MVLVKPSLPLKINRQSQNHLSLRRISFFFEYCLVPIFLSIFIWASNHDVRRKLRPQKPPGLPSQLPLPTCCCWMSVRRTWPGLPLLASWRSAKLLHKLHWYLKFKEGDIHTGAMDFTGNAAPKHFPHAWESIVKPDAFLESHLMDLLFAIFSSSILLLRTWKDLLCS